MLGEVAEWEIVRKTMALLSGGRMREMRYQASQMLQKLADESLARARADVDLAEAQLLERLANTFEGVHLQRAQVEVCSEALHRLRVLHGIAYRRAGAAGLVGGKGEGLGVRTRDLLSWLGS